MQVVDVDSSEKTAAANVMVKNLPDGTKAVDIRALISQYGKVLASAKYIFGLLYEFLQ